jgi:O-antigen/teichoic acid export membrane protein
MTGMRRTIVRNITANYVAFGVSSLVTLLLTPFLIGRLNATHFGAWVLLKTILAYFQLMELGIMPAVIRYVSLHNARKEQKEVESVIGGAMRLLIGVSALTVPVVGVVAWLGPRMFNLPPDLEPIFVRGVLLIGLAAIVAYFRRLLIATLQGFQRYDLMNACSVSSTVLGAVATLIFVFRGHGILTLIVILLVRTAAEAVVELVLIRRLFGIRPSPFRSSREAVKRITGYSVFAFLVDLAVNISHRIDVLVIGIFLPVASITFYEIATRISGALEKITGPLIGMFFPMASEFDSSRNPEALRALLLAGTRATVLMVTPGLVIIGAHGAKIIGWWVGPEYIDASLPVLHIFLGVVLMAVFDSTAARILLGTGQVRFDAMVSLSMAVLNLVLSLSLVGTLGIVGVALGTLIPATLGNFFVSVPYTCRITGTRIVPFYLHVFLPVLGIAGIGLLFISLTKHLVSHDVLAVALDSLFVLSVTGVVFLKVVRDASRAGTATSQG